MFTNRDLKKLILPLVIEQLLAVAMGMADTVMVSSCGEAAVSGISLVDSISILLIGLFGAMASGGSVIAAQYIGKNDREKVARSANQLFLSVGVLSVFFMTAALIWNRQILSLIYGNIEADVMKNARIYFYITALSYPFLGIYNGAAALFRVAGNSRVSMQVSLVANGLNVAGNALFIFGFGMGAAGAGLSTLLSRILSAALICLILWKGREIPVSAGVHLDGMILKKILYVGIPNGLENSIFQIGKLILSSLISSFGTAAITANAVTCSVGNLQLIPASAIGIAMTTVVGQCVGAGKPDQARAYLYKLIRIAYVFVIVIGVLLLLFGKPVCSLYHLSDETLKLTLQLLYYNSICCMLVHPLSFAQANGLRAANDVKFTMFVSVGSMWICRIGLAYLLAQHLGLGVLGIWIAMTIDWVVRSAFFTTRVLSGGWEKHMRLTAE